MKIHLRADETPGIHTRFTVFIDGANCGQLCMRDHEAVVFHMLLQWGAEAAGRDEFVSSGDWGQPRGEPM